MRKPRGMVSKYFTMIRIMCLGSGVTKRSLIFLFPPTSQGLSSSNACKNDLMNKPGQYLKRPFIRDTSYLGRKNRSKLFGLSGK
jgi:hypothetical protein